jgi:HD-GYP domain-containing protein (c-di-GMP phosphodiesterase class II)
MMKFKPSLIPISLATLIDGASLGVDVYLRPRPGVMARILFSRNEAIDLRKLNLDDEGGAKRILIDRRDRERYEQYLKGNWENILADTSVPVESRLSVMNLVVRDVMKESFSEGSTNCVVASAEAVATSTVEFINSEAICLQQLCRVLQHDYTTFAHSTNVSFFCTLLSKHMGYSSADQREIAIGGLLHDIGKLEISEQILKKPERLSWDEYCLLQRHPLTGFERLADRDDVSFGQLMMTYQHHERLDGTGYPCGVLGDEIHPWAKVCAIVDVFEAVTAERPYRTPLTHSEAATLLNKGRGKEFDSDLLDAWLELVEQREVENADHSEFGQTVVNSLV